MAGMGNIATTAIITGGLTGGHTPVDPCKSGLITSPFSLYCRLLPKPVPPPGSGGGPYPGNAWNKFNPGQIQDFYKPVDPTQQYYIVPRDQEANYFRRHKIVTMRIQLGDIVVEKEYAVPEKRARALVKTLNLINATVANIKITASNFKRITSEAIVKIKNLRLGK